MKLDQTDVCSMLRLVGDLAALRGNHAVMKRFLMDGMSKLIGADAWAWTLSCRRDPDKPQVYSSFLNGGMSDDRLVKVLQAIEHPEMVQVTAKFFNEIKEKQAHLTRVRYQITDKDWFETSDANLAWKAADIGPTIMSLRPLDNRSSSVVAFYRGYSKPEFTPRDLRIAHIVLTEVAWLHEQGWPEDRGVDVPSLSKRLRLVLNLLILGQSRKQIAANLQISSNTAHGYIKEIYRIFRVSSQSELISRFLQGDGHDVR